ncbi:MAG: YeeE/YedE family protein [Vulcanimicrobiaceae bacterium]
MRYFAGIVCGALFGLGLAISGMADPNKVIGFLDVRGNWDPSLLFVLGGAVAVTAIAFRFIPALRRPVFGRAFEKKPDTHVDRRLLGGAALFGIGWGISGYCPGPGIVSLSRFAPDAIIFVLAFLGGSLLYRFALLKRPNAANSIV